MYVLFVFMSRAEKVHQHCITREKVTPAPLPSSELTRIAQIILISLQEMPHCMDKRRHAMHCEWRLVNSFENKLSSWSIYYYRTSPKTRGHRTSSASE